MFETKPAQLKHCKQHNNCTSLERSMTKQHRLLVNQRMSNPLTINVHKLQNNQSLRIAKATRERANTKSAQPTDISISNCHPLSVQIAYFRSQNATASSKMGRP
jgi:hypothetical protein